jgi:hypothetical protein
LYANLYHDHGYNSFDFVRNILIDTIASVSVATLFDVDATHKKGDTINDIVEIKYRMVYDYIQARYTGVFPGQLSQKLNEFNAQKKLMVKSDWISLELPRTNPKPVKQQYAVSMKFTSGKVISDTTSVFE